MANGNGSGHDDGIDGGAAPPQDAGPGLPGGVPPAVVPAARNADVTNTVAPDPCWPHDYEQEISQHSYGRYFRKWKAAGPEYDSASMPPMFAGKIYAPVSTGDTITVEVRFLPVAETGVTADDVTAAKAKLESGVNTYWNSQFKLQVTDPQCGTKAFTIQYKVVWVSSGQHYKFDIHDTWPREGVTGDRMDVSKTTSDWVYAHEFGHAVGLPDEYAYVPGAAETVKYIKPDGSLDDPVSCPYNGKSSTDASATIMAAYGNTSKLLRHGWTVAIEVAALLSAKTGRNIQCVILYGFSS